jgi:hypothetical protein
VATGSGEPAAQGGGEPVGEHAGGVREWFWGLGRWDLTIEGYPRWHGQRGRARQ